MKAGDLVIMPDRLQPQYNIGTSVGIIVDSEITNNCIAVLWPDADGEVSYEPIMFLEVIG